MIQPVIYPENRLQSTVISERPQERMLSMGAGGLSDTELLAMLLRSGTRGMDVLTLAGKLIKEAGSLAGLIGWQVEDYRKLKGIGPIKALQLVTVMEVARRVLMQEKGDSPLLNQADLVAEYLRPIAQGLAVEKFWVLSLNRRNCLIKCTEVSSGTATARPVAPSIVNPSARNMVDSRERRRISCIPNRFQASCAVSDAENFRGCPKSFLKCGEHSTLKDCKTAIIVTWLGRISSPAPAFNLISFQHAACHIILCLCCSSLLGGLWLLLVSH